MARVWQFSDIIAYDNRIKQIRTPQKKKKKKKQGESGPDEVGAVGGEREGPGRSLGGGHRAVGVDEVDELLRLDGVYYLGVFLHEEAVPPDVRDRELGRRVKALDGALDDAQALFDPSDFR